MIFSRNEFYIVPDEVSLVKKILLYNLFQYVLFRRHCFWYSIVNFSHNCINKTAYSEEYALVA